MTCSSNSIRRPAAPSAFASASTGLRGEPAENRVAAAPEFGRLLGRPVERAEPAVTLNDEAVTLAAVQSENPKVRIYQIE
jgi:hypothetical protein